MAKFLFEASYTAEGLRGLTKDKASGRQKAVTQAITGMGGKLEAFYYAFGDADVILIVDFPDNTAAAAMSLAVAASGLVSVKTTALMTVDEVDQAIGKQVGYRAPGT
jgi:uncharacterized protein with GYD domain